MSAIAFNRNSSWQSAFSFDHVKCLIVCRGPIRLQAMTVFKELGVNFGMLLSEKDSIVYLALKFLFALLGNSRNGKRFRDLEIRT